jgi:hypothetical protein
MSALFHIRTQASNRDGSDLFALLESATAVRFGSNGSSNGAWSGELIDSTAPASATSQNGLPRLSFCGEALAAKQEVLAEIEVCFTDDPDVPFPFRGKMVKGKVAGAVRDLTAKGDEKVLATVQSKPVWTLARHGKSTHFRSGFPLPKVSPDQSLRDVLNGERFFELLPLLHFLHVVTGRNSYQGLPLRACFMIDDPNLHRPSYGFVNFREMAERAARENYHVSFATVPLDAWFAHREVANLFRQNSKQLSLLIHGNNHTHKELAGDYTQEQRTFLLTQAVARAKRLEQKGSVAVSRVMAPPHGACSDDMLHELPRCGFESATISHGSLRSFNRGKAWTRNVGYEPCEWIRGCPVLPRWGFGGNCRNTVLLAAFLKQPIILMGHHQDLRDGLEVLDELGRLVNGLGPVMWSNMTEISRANYLWRQVDGTLRVKIFGRKVTVPCPAGSTNLVLEQPRPRRDANWLVAFGEQPPVKIRAGESIEVPSGFTGQFFIESIVDSFVSKGEFLWRSPPWAVIRRLLTEGRDRFSN